MTSLNNRDKDLHHDDGSHRATPPTANGLLLQTWEWRILAHLQAHEPDPQAHDSRGCKYCEAGEGMKHNPEYPEAFYRRDPFADLDVPFTDR